MISSSDMVAIDDFLRSGVGQRMFAYLRHNAPVPSEREHAHQQTLQAGRAKGWADCLDMILSISETPDNG